MTTGHDEEFEIDPTFAEDLLVFIESLTNTGQKCCDVIQKKNAPNKGRAIKTLRRVIDEIEKASQGLKTCMSSQTQETIPLKKH